MPDQEGKIQASSSQPGKRGEESPSNRLEPDRSQTKKSIDEARAILAALTTARKNETFYPARHPTTVRSVEILFNMLQNMLTYTGRFAFDIFEEELFFEETFLAEESLVFSQFIADCEERKIGSITFSPGLELKEVADFLHLLNKKPDELEQAGGITKNLMKEGISHIILGALREIREAEKDKSEQELSALALKNYRLVLQAFSEIAQDVKEGQLVNARRATKMVRPLVDLVLQDKMVVLGLSTIKNYDQYTYYHSVNVLVLSLVLGTELALEKVPLMTLGTAALLHDIGKIKMPLEILKKPASLTSEEWTSVKRHPVDGAEMLSATPDLNKLIMVVAFEHHMGYNHSGYPDIKSKRPMHLFSRMVQIADVYDAITSDRYYRRAELPDKALNTMLELSGAILDPLILKVFINMMGIYPVGSMVKLDSNEIGVVFRPNPKDLTRPQIKLIQDANGIRIEPQVADLAEKDNERRNFRRTISHSLRAQALKIDVTQYL